MLYGYNKQIRKEVISSPGRYNFLLLENMEKEIFLKIYGGQELALLITVLLTILTDQLSKFLIQRAMELGQSIPVIDNIFHITYILNPGAAFGILANRTVFFIIATVLVVLGVIIFYFRSGQKKGMLPVALGLLLGGAAGNLIDRLRYAKVVDFIDFRVWPVFNLADTAIVCGAGLLVLILWFSEKEKSRDRVDSDANG
ncbi:lipoprotein signal peptidase [Desulfocucumis palustris]|uniref:Lipoprotein signal peptidase n=1 Tax=Desulfocucumis palustris TaxID=1898651 RepID=A0A2L2X9V1_9FIRM|nr:lipoprotein signal peptidase [Desulfocucumis palustris]